MIPSESNPFARAVADKTPPSRFSKRARFVLGVTLSLVLAACFTIAIVLLFGLIVRGARRGDFVALGAAIAVRRS